VLRTEEYAPGRLLDVHGDGEVGIVLMWHGRGPNERDVLTTLAGTVAAEGYRVLVPDWNSEADDGGRSDLLASLDWARRQSEDSGRAGELALVGWSLGGTAAVGLAVQPSGTPLDRVVTLAANFDSVDPISGVRLPDPLAPSNGRTHIVVIHGDRDEVVDPAIGRDGARRLQQAGWPVSLVNTGTDHAGVVMTAYDEAVQRCVPTDDEVRLRQGQVVIDGLRSTSSG
jgi:alpha/beta superfamily hydrolase